MPITLASYNGGIDKTTTAVHLATSPQMPAPTLELGSDCNRDAIPWTQHGKGVPFKVVEEVQAVRDTRDVTPTKIDNEQAPAQVDLQARSEGCDLLITPPFRLVSTLTVWCSRFGRRRTSTANTTAASTVA